MSTPLPRGWRLYTVELIPMMRCINDTVYPVSYHRTSCKEDNSCKNPSPSPHLNSLHCVQTPTTDNRIFVFKTPLRSAITFRKTFSSEWPTLSEWGEKGGNPKLPDVFFFWRSVMRVCGILARHIGATQREETLSASNARDPRYKKCPFKRIPRGPKSPQ